MPPGGASGLAPLVLSVAQVPADEKVKELFHLTEELEQWVKRPTGGKGP